LLLDKQIKLNAAHVVVEAQLVIRTTLFE
jgi:hypothetical protein